MALLVFTTLASSIVAGGRSTPIVTASLAVLAVTLGSAGANVLTSYLDRDIDAVMNRTKLRPIPSRRIYPPEKALLYGLSLAALSITISYIISPLVVALMVFGLADNIIIYSRILKRRNPISIVLGGFSGGVPAAIGFFAVPQVSKSWIIGLVLASLVVLWIPTHIWSLALRVREDYARAKIPMLPVVVSEKIAVRCIGSTSVLMVFFTLLPSVTEAFGALYLVTAVVFGGIMLALNLWLIARPSKAKAWTVFKFSSPYLALMFLAMAIDSIAL